MSLYASAARMVRILDAHRVSGTPLFMVHDSDERLKWLALADAHDELSADLKRVVAELKPYQPKPEGAKQ